MPLFYTPMYMTLGLINHITESTYFILVYR